MGRKVKVTIVQPVLAPYRRPLFSALARYADEMFLIADVESGGILGVSLDEAKTFDAKTVNFCGFRACTNIDAYKKLSKSDAILHFADFKFISLWFSMLCSLLFKVNFFLHGQGGYKRSGIVVKFLYNIVLSLSDGYICYTEFSRDNLKKITLKSLHKKIFVVDNSLYLPLRRVEKPGADLLYIGRLRAGCGIELLLEAAKAVNLNVKVVGGGEDVFINDLRSRYDNFVSYGALYDEKEQFNIAQNCFAGAYGGDAGLSVVHYMSYGLPVIVHNDNYKHMGPEPSYVVNGENGLTFQRGNLDSLIDVLKKLNSSPDLQKHLAAGAAKTFEKLNTPPMHEKFAKILGFI